MSLAQITHYHIHYIGITLSRTIWS